MEVCLIAPTPLLFDLTPKSNTHLVLAHQYKTDSKYAGMYASLSYDGDFIMLDNSAYELGTSMDVNVLKEIARTLQPSAIFLPDKRFDREATLKMVVEAIDILKPLGINLFAVPQGNSLEDVILCYDQLVELGVDGFGIYEEIGEVTGLGRRWDFLAYLQATHRVQAGKYYHMLGMEEDLENIQKLAKFGWVNSIDSVKPIAYGLYGIQLDSLEGAKVPYPHRQENYFELGFGEFESIVQRNCELVINWAHKSK